MSAPWKFNKDKTNEHTKAHKISALNKELQVIGESWEQVRCMFPGKNTLISYLVPNGQPWKHTWNNFLRTEQVIFRNSYTYISYIHVLYTCTYIHAITVNKIRYHEFEGKQGEVYGGLWKEEMEGNSITISKIKLKN